MADPQQPRVVKHVCGVLAADAAVLDRAVELLGETLGPVGSVSETWAFDFTRYYEKEMGSGLLRRFVAFREPAGADLLAGRKRLTHLLERRIAEELPAGPPRPVNLDPGYVAPDKLVLASMKDFSHRILLGRQVYAEVTLMYRDGAWRPLPWTFPDYASGQYDAFLTACREELLARARERRS